MHAMQLRNVVLSDELEKAVNGKAGSTPMRVQAHAQLEPVIFKLATLYPTWTFTALRSSYLLSDDRDMAVCMEFAVSCDGEGLGKIFRKYEGRDYQVCVSNDRIRKAMERYPHYYKTKDPDKAIAKVKKMFRPQDHGERLAEAYKTAEDAAQQADWSKSRECHTTQNAVKQIAEDYVLGPGFETFMAYAKETMVPTEYDKLVENHQTALKAREDLATIHAVKNVLAGSTPGIVITRHGGGYITAPRVGAPRVYDDRTLPEWMRGGLGMLKLIEAGQFVSGTGMRASEHTFVLIGSDSDLTDVSEGDTQ